MSDTRPTTPHRAADATEAMDLHSSRAETDLSHRTTGSSAPSSPQTRPSGQRQLLLALLATTALAVFLRLVLLDQLQAEIYGDIAIVYEYLIDIRAGRWPTYFILSSGPLYHYLIMPVIAITGPSYFGMKLGSALVSLGVLAATYALSRRLLGDRFAVVALFVAGVSSWLLIFSRLGNSQIVVPLLSITALWLLVRFVQSGQQRNLVASAVVAALGLYGYPQSFVLPVVLGLTLVCLCWTEQRVRWRDVGLFAQVAIICALPFVWIVSRDPANFFSGYIGSKLFEGQNPLQALLQNIGKVLLSLHISGDSGFRSNPMGQAHLDMVSGLLFLAGILFWLRPERRRWSPVLLVPLILQHLPSALVLNSPSDVPSASRTLGAAPIAYILVASGLWWLVQIGGRRRWAGPTLALIGLGAILGLNAQRYFQNYIGGLPYKNTPVARIITTYVNALPPETQIYLVRCCWEEGMPEPKSIQYAINRPDTFHHIETESMTCEKLQTLPQPSVFIWSFHEALPDPQIAPCRQWLTPELHSSAEGRPVFNAALLRRDTPIEAQAPIGEQFKITEIIVDGKPIEVRYSPLDIGSILDVFDGNRETLMRGKEANPLVIELRFAQPRSVAQVGLDLGSMARFQVTTKLTRPDGTVGSIVRDYENLPPDPHIDIPINENQLLTVRIEILAIGARPNEGWHIHVREVELR